MTLADPRLLPAQDEPEAVVQFRSHAPHQHAEPHLIYLISGAGSVRLAAGEHPLAPGTGLWLDAGVEHELRLEGPGVVLGPLLSPSARPPRGRERRVQSPELHELMTILLARWATPGFDRLLFRDSMERVLAEIGTDWFDLVLPRHAAAREIALAAPTSTATLADLAAEQFLSTRQVQRIFLEQTGLPFATWRSRARLNRAIAALRRGEGMRAAVTDSGFGSRRTLRRALAREAVEVGALLPLRASPHPAGPR
ncbi:helix-turn-helix domain-containing protein [Pseudactinotalea sp.]|uniref:helix-turn-helix domain-containing protein n=1 Tax=Pseudactinotalea sp. TaxID=1926260 RepID=UPI003B3A7D51